MGCERAHALMRTMDWKDEDAVSEFLNAWREELLLLEHDALAAEVESRIDPAWRRYGRLTHSLMGPMGYFYPSIIEDLVVGNLKRGRLYKTAENPRYIYDFDVEGRILRIQDNGNRNASTFCQWSGQDFSAATFERMEGGMLEITTSALVQYDGEGRMRRSAYAMWLRNLTYITRIAGEVYGEIRDFRQHCECSSTTSTSDRCQNREEFELFYNEKMKIEACHRLMWEKHFLDGRWKGVFRDAKNIYATWGREENFKSPEVQQRMRKNWTEDGWEIFCDEDGIISKVKKI